MTTVRIDESKLDIWTPGFDASVYQDLDTTPRQIDFQQAYARGMRFCFLKASQGLRSDSDWMYNWESSGRTPLLRGPYHFVDYRYRAGPQAEFVCGLVRENPGQLPPVLDLEKLWEPRPSRANMLAWVKEWFEVADRLSGRECIFYSNPDALLYWLAPIPDWLAAHPLWIAHYGVKAPVYKGWPRWTFWQHASTGDGLYYGMESKGLDMNWYNGTLEELRTFCGLTTPTPPPALSLEERVARLESEARAKGWSL